MRRQPTTEPAETEIVSTLHGSGWVVEHREPNGFVSTLPLVGWAVLSDGTIRPLPFDMPANATVRPRRESDKTRIDATARGKAQQFIKPRNGVDIPAEGVTRYEL